MTDTRTRRRETILRAAIDEFCRCGFERARMDAIAASANIGKSTIYEYFPSKTALLEAVGETMYTRVADEVSAIMQADVPFRAKAVNYLRMIEHTFGCLGDKMLSMRSENASLQMFHDLTQRYLSEIWDTLSQAVRTAQRAGELRGDLDAQVVTSMLIAMPHPAMVFNRSVRTEELVDALMRGIAP